ncbi:MAG: hypothetical protein V7711_12160 [Pseudomonadales bacterium]
MSQLLAKRKYSLALMSLVAPGDIHSRVAAALSMHLLHIDEENDFVEPAKSSHSDLIKSLEIENPHTDHVREKINAMSEVDVEKIAQHIVATYEKLVSN